MSGININKMRKFKLPKVGPNNITLHSPVSTSDDDGTEIINGDRQRNILVS